MTNPEVEGLVEPDTRRLISDMRAVLAHHRFTAERVGQPGCEVRKIAAEHADTIERAITVLTHPLPDGDGGEREKIVAWLNRCADDLPDTADGSETALIYRGLATAIEIGAHLTTSEPRT